MLLSVLCNTNAPNICAVDMKSELCRNIGCFHDVRALSQSLHTNAEIGPSNRSWLPTYTYLSTYRPLIFFISFVVVQRIQ
jgi:hypothetical protein